MPVTIPEGVQVTLNDTEVSVSGPKGELSWRFHQAMKIEMADKQITVTRPSNSKTHCALHGLTRALIHNMVVGVSTGFEKVLEIDGVGYRAILDEGRLKLMLGLSHPVEIEPKEGIAFEVKHTTMPGSTRRYYIVKISGADKQVVGQQAAEIRKLRPPEPYKGSGIRYRGERIRRKAGKAGKAGAEV